MTRWFFLLTGLVGLLAVLSGCSANNSHSSLTAGARATISMHWPERDTRLIPQAANSIELVVSGSNGFTSHKVLARPSTGTTSSETITVPAGHVTFTATAHPNADGTGTAQASGSVSYTAVGGQNFSVSLTMNSTIDHVEITPATPRVLVAATLQLTATAKNAAGEVVLVPTTGGFIWASSNTSTATVSENGLVSGKVSGSVTITAKEKESNKSTTTTVTVSTAQETPVTLKTFVTQGNGTKTATNATWVAFQDGDGTWTRLQPSKTGEYTGTVTNAEGRYGFAVVAPLCQRVIQTTLDEMPSIALDVTSADTGKAFSVTLTNASQDATAYAAVVGTNAYSGWTCSTGPDDLALPDTAIVDGIATWYGQDDVAKQLVIKNGLSNNGSAVNFNFSGSDKIDLTTSSIGFSGGSLNGYFPMVSFQTDNGPAIGVSAMNQDEDGSLKFGALSSTHPSGFYTVSTSDEICRYYLRSRAVPNGTKSIPTALSTTASSTITTQSPFVRATLTCSDWPMQAKFLEFGLSDESIDSYAFWTVSITPGWITNKSGFTYTFPDLSKAAGWQSSWGFVDCAVRTIDMICSDAEYDTFCPVWFNTDMSGIDQISYTDFLLTAPPSGGESALASKHGKAMRTGARALSRSLRVRR